MADLSPPDGADGRRERGQLLLVTAIGLAVLLVTLALLLNALIFTENVALREGAAKHAPNAVDYRLEAERTVASLLRDSNRDTGGFATLNEEFTDRVANWSDLTGRHVGTTGAVTSTVPHQTEGARIAQDNATRSFTNGSVDPATKATSWTLVDGTPGVRTWWLDVSRGDLVATSAIDDESDASDLVDAGVFRAIVSNGTHAWRVFVYQDDATDVRVRVESPDGSLSGACGASETDDGTVLVNVTGATVGGTDCPPLAAVDLGGDSFDVAYRGGDNATGTYSLVVNRTEGAVDDDDLASPGSGRPYATGAIYASQVEVVYATPSFRYDATVDVAPGEIR